MGSTIGSPTPWPCAGWLQGRKSHVNLIPYNPVAGLPYERPDPAAVGSVRTGRAPGPRGASATVRKTKGRSIDAACGQLRRRVEPASAPSLPTTADSPMMPDSLDGRM